MAVNALREESTTKGRFYKKRLLGQLALREKKITKEQLDEVIKKQIQLWENGDGRKIGQLLVESGYMTSAEVHELLQKQDAMDRIRKRTFRTVEKDRKSKSKDGQASSLIVRYEPGEVIFNEGDDTHRDLFVIQSGEIGVYRDSIHLGKRFETGAFLGTTSCLLKTPRISTAIAITGATLLRIPEEGVKSFFAKNPQMSLKLSSVLAQRLLNLTEKYIHEVKKDKVNNSDIEDDMLLGVAVNDDNRRNTAAEPVSSGKVNGKIDISHVNEGAGKTVSAVEDSACYEEQNFVSGAESEDTDSSADTQTCAVEQESATASSDVVSFCSNEMLKTAELADSSAGELPDVNMQTHSAGTDENQESRAGEEDNREAESAADDIPEPVDPINEVMQDPDTAVTLPQGELKAIIEAEKPLEFTDKIRSLLDRRLDMYLRLDDVAQRRNALEEKESTTDRAKNELSSLRRELSKIPPYEPLKMKCDKLAEMLAPPDPEASSDEQAKPQLTKDVIQAYEISVEQKRLLLDWYDSMGELTRICAEVAVDQLMYKVLLRVGVNPVPVFGWAVYALAMNEYLVELRENHKNLRGELKKIKDEEEANNSGGLLKLFKKKPAISEEELDAKEKKKNELEKAELELRLKTAGITKELAAVEVVMVEAFWAVYGALGLRLVSGVDKEAEPYVRAYLRWGVLGMGQDFMNSELLLTLLEECSSGAQLPGFNMNNNYILYADEIIELTAKKKLLPSPNEELELNERNSPRWKADRAHRRIVGGEFFLGILQDLQGMLEEDAKGRRDQENEKQKELDALAADDPDKKKKTVALKKARQALKVAAVKAEKLVEKVRDDMVPKIADDVQAGREALEELGIDVDPQELARHEITCIRRFCRLIAKLKEPFLPFTLRDRFNPSLKTTNTKEDVLAGLEELEKKDPLIFKENMLATMKKNNRVQIRSCPFIHLLPASGGMGFLVAPRTDTYSGKLLIPGYFERTGQREDVMIEIMSDFRYDTSKEQAGNDVMNSDTLVAAYAEVRWILRKKDKEVRQKAGIFTDENERTNWRRHYAMYINSAYDSGKQLFFKCPDLYELIINKFIELPDGIEVLKRG